MKFSTFNLLILLSVSSALSLNLKDIVDFSSSIPNALRNNNILFIKDNQDIENNQNITNAQGIENDQVIDTVTQLQCQTSIKNLNCEMKEQDDPKNFNYDEICKPLSDKKCEAIYNNGISELEGCKDIPPEKLKIINEELKSGYAILKMLCEYDEEGKECPFTTFMRETMKKDMVLENLPNSEQLMEIIEKTCKSKKCSESLAKSLTDSEANLEMKSTVDELLLGEKCVKAHGSTSGTSLTIKKLGTTMLITVSLLLVYLLN
ncbi:hypothetical protein BCR32DRAFT_296933 [Anaeromyces robustus]|uniref:Uncharacterized protein n=1 Tax=Anaeromyces robustus TaxID=1754192 RepID=A0A1Y1WPI3_9FUNG|nr:hypothetical protein BCR32DRAFT_296933 [Anaeromyces robustus]|eukprot:ORX75392.1 hypothetical protein BCR32DRAFT_296933 [Anaeromyces robustus]